MKRFRVLVALLGLLTMSCAAVVNKTDIHANAAIEFPPQREIRVGVLPLLSPTPGKDEYSGYWGGTGTTKTLEHSGHIVADAITSALIGIDNLTIIERSQLEKILREHELTLTGIVKSPDLNVLGRILPVDALMFGTVSSFHQWNEPGNWGAVVAFNARLVDVHTGEILCTLVGAANEHNGAPEEMAYRLARAAIQKILHHPR